MCTFENFRSSEKESASSVLTSMRVCPHTCDSFLVQGSFHYGGISLTNHTEILCKQYENALFNHGNAFLVSKKSWLEGGEVWRRGAVPLRRWRGEAFQQDSQLAARAEGGRPSIFRLAPCLHKKYWFRLKEILLKESLSTHYSEKKAVVLWCIELSFLVHG